MRREFEANGCADDQRSADNDVVQIARAFMPSAPSDPGSGNPRRKADADQYDRGINQNNHKGHVEVPGHLAEKQRRLCEQFTEQGRDITLAFSASVCAEPRANVFDDHKSVGGADGIALSSDQRNGVIEDRVSLDVRDDTFGDEPNKKCADQVGDDICRYAQDLHGISAIGHGDI